MGTPDSMAGALDGAPIAAFGRTRWAEYFNEFSSIANDYVTASQPAASAGEGATVSRSEYDWKLTKVSEDGSASIGTFATTDGMTGVLRLIAPGGEGSSGPIVQLTGSAGAGTSPLGLIPNAAGTLIGDQNDVSVDSDAVFVTRIQLTRLNRQGIFAGLAELNATSPIIGNESGPIDSDTHIGFAQADSDDGNIYFTVAGDTAAEAVNVTDIINPALLDEEWIELAVRATGTNHYRGYVRRKGQSAVWTKVADGTLSTGWDAQMLISFANVAEGANMDIDYVYFSQKRGLVA